MKRIAVITLMLALSVFNFYAAYSPQFSRRYFPLPIKSESLLKAVRVFAGVVFLLVALVLLVGAFVPTVPED